MSATKRREIYKFLSGFLAGAGVVHANMGFSIASGIFNEPYYFGHTWGAGSLWIGAAVYLLASLVLGYLGWRRERRQDAQPTPLRQLGLDRSSDISVAISPRESRRKKVGARFPNSDLPGSDGETCRSPSCACPSAEVRCESWTDQALRPRESSLLPTVVSSTRNGSTTPW